MKGGSSLLELSTHITFILETHEPTLVDDNRRQLIVSVPFISSC